MQTAEIIVTLEKAIEQDWPVVARAAIERLQELETIVAWHEERFQAARDAWDMLTAMTREDERVKAHQLLLDAISGVRFVNEKPKKKRGRPAPPRGIEICPWCATKLKADASGRLYCPNIPKCDWKQ
jgi:hypothetical protein